MNPLGSNTTSIGVILRGDSTSFVRSLGQASTATKAFEAQQTASASRWSAGWKVAGAVVGVALLAVATGLLASTRAAAEFEVKMRNVNSLVQQGDEYYNSMSQSVLEISRVVPQSANQLADGLYDVTSSGFQGAESLMVLEASAIAASAGMTDTASAVQGITAVLNAYGLSARDATDVSDILFQTVNLGVVRFEELTSVLGSVVGLASAAKVPIEDVGAAIATMTLSGIGAPEAGTALNRLIQGLIQPSESLANLYQRLGYESGAAALEQRGLHTVLEDIREATGGNVTAYLQLFPEIRATRAAFALASAEGETYNRVQGDIADANERTGATQRAFDEQMKATANRFTVLTSGLQSNAVTIGLQILPAFDALLEAGQAISDGFIPAMESAEDALTPFLSSLYNTGVNVVEILRALWEAAEPVAASLAKIAGAGVVTALNLVGDTLEAITGLMADNKEVTVVLAALYLSRFLPSLTALTTGLTQFGRTLQYNVIWRLSEWRTAQMQATAAQVNAGRWNNSFTQGLGRTQAALMATGAAAKGMGAAMLASGVGTAALAAGIGLLIYAAQTADQGVKTTIGEIQSGVDELDQVSLERAVGQMRDLKASVSDVEQVTVEWYKKIIPVWGATDGLVGAWNEYQGNKQIAAANEALGEQTQLLINAKVNTRLLAEETGLTYEEAARLAERQGVNLTDWYDTEEAEEARNELIRYLEDIEQQTGISTEQMAKDWEFNTEQMDAFAAAVAEAMESVRSSLASDNDVLGTWKPNIGVEEEKKALDNLREAREELNKVERDSERTSDQLSAARKRVSEADQAYTDAQQKRAEGTLESFYRKALTTTTEFSNNISRALELGLDPSIIARLLEEGPEQAGPIVQAMVDDTTGSLIDMVNASEAALSEVSSRIVEQARLTAVAVNSETDEMAKALPQAMEISMLAWEGFTASEIADKLGMTTSDAVAIASQFGIALVDEVDRRTAAIGSVTGGSGRPINVGMYADGGVYPGYTPGRDIGFIGVSGGEAIMRPEWTRFVGKGQVDYWNYLARTGSLATMRQSMSPFLGGFAGGGIAGQAPTMVPYPVTSRHDEYMPVHIDKGYFTDPEAAARYGRDRRRRDQWAGRRTY